MPSPRVDLDTLTDGESDTELVALVRAKHRLDAELARRAHRWDAPGSLAVGMVPGPRGPGCPAPPACRRAPPSGGCVTAVTSPRCRPPLRRGRAARSAPATSTCWPGPPATAGVGGTARDETVLVAQCGELTFGQVVKAVRLLVPARRRRTGPRRDTAAEAVHAEPAQRVRRFDLRRLHVEPGDRWGHSQRSVTPHRTRPVPPRPARQGDPHHQ